jgi:hypothetical protein
MKPREKIREPISVLFSDKVLAIYLFLSAAKVF